jgi:endonuclease III
LRGRQRSILGPVAIEEVIELLEREYGPREWRSDRDPVDVLIQTILSQNTSDTNSDRAFASLKAGFDNWEAIVEAPVDHVARAIQSGGLFRIKAARIQRILDQIRQEQGHINLDALRELMSISEAADYLMRLPGVGHKTASCVLLFSLGKPSLPVDTHVFRVAKRLGLVDCKVSAEEAHSLLQEQTPPALMYQFHVHMIEHGRRICHARRPRCNSCILRDVCPGATR